MAVLIEVGVTVMLNSLEFCYLTPSVTELSGQSISTSGPSQDQGVRTTQEIHPKHNWWNLVKFPCHITITPVVQSFCNFAQSTAVALPCSVQNIKMIGRLKMMLWDNDISFQYKFWMEDRPSSQQAAVGLAGSSANLR